MQPAQAQGDRIPILIVGASGRLGRLITKECLKKNNLLVNTLLPNSHECQDLCNEVKNRGGKCIDGDITKPETIKGSTKNIHTVISAVDGDEKVILDGQNALLRDCIENNVKRFVPSEFTFDLRKIDPKEHPTLANKIAFRKKIQESPVKLLSIHCGTLIESVMEQFANGVFAFDNSDTKYALTSAEDVAKVVAAAVAKPDKTGDIVICGDHLALKELVNRYNAVRNTKVQILKCGEKADLQKAIEACKGKGDITTCHALIYQKLIGEGKGVLADVNVIEFPDVKPRTVEQFLKDHPELKLGENLSADQLKQNVQKIIPGIQKVEQMSV